MTARGGETDAGLIARFRAGEEKCFEELVRRHQKRVYWLARRIVGNHDDADDVVQEVFIKVYHGLRNFRGEANFSTWLYRITVNMAIGAERKKKARQLLRITHPSSSIALHPSLSFGERGVNDVHGAGVSANMNARSVVGPYADGVNSSDAQQRLEDQERRALIEEAIAQLPKKQRLVFVLRYYDELSYVEISKILKTSVGGLKANYYHALKKIAAFVRSAYTDGR